MKNRLLRNRLKEKTKSRFGRIVTLTGARQTGKTTLLKHEFQDYQYISFDDPITRIHYLNMSAEQWYQQYPRAILDEVQKVPQVIETIKAVHDKYGDSKYILSGSSQINLMEQVKESLAGRTSIFELYSLTLNELATNSWNSEIKQSRLMKWLKCDRKDTAIFQGIPLATPQFATDLKNFQDYLQYGAMPVMSISALTKEEKYDWLSDYITTYIQRDVRDIGNIKDLEPFVLLQKMSASLTGELLNYNELAKLCRISSKTAMKFISYLAISYQVVLLQPWFRNINRRLVKSPKLHFLDPGVQRRLLSRSGELTGHEYESAVISEIIRQIKSNKFDVEFYHIRTHDGREVDLLLELPEGFVPIEIKKNENITMNDARHLKKISEILDKPILHSFILSNDCEVKSLNSEITALPTAWLLGNSI